MTRSLRSTDTHNNPLCAIDLGALEINSSKSFLVLMKKTQLGILLGTIAGIIDVIPMLIQNLTWDANLGAFSMWIVCGFLISTNSLKINGILKGIFISFLVLLPSAFIIGWNDPLSLIPIGIMTLILGSLLGFLINKFGR